MYFGVDVVFNMNYTPTEVGGFWEHHRRMIEHLASR